MVALSAEGGGDVEVPPTLRALLAARLDQLAEPERRVLERGAVEGELFHRGTVQALAPEETEVTPRLAALVRRDLVRPDRPVLPREDAYRFRHLLIRDAAYDALPKATRADLHRRFAAWLENHGEQLVELDEILGYHLEQAARYLDELGLPDPDLAERAGERLAAAGRRALWREDKLAASSLLTRALELTRPVRFDAALELDLVAASARTQNEAVDATEAIVRTSEAREDRIGELRARVEAAHYRLFLQPETVAEAEAVASEALVELESSDDHAALAEAWRLRGNIDNVNGQMERWAYAAEHALTHGLRVSKDWYEPVGLAGALVNGPRPAGDALATLDRFFDPTPASYVGYRARLLAMLDRLEEARALAAEGRSRLSELNPSASDLAPYASDLAPYAEVAMLDGDYEGAAETLLKMCEWMQEQGATSLLSTYAPLLARLLWTLGRDDDAHRWAQLGRELGDEHDVMTQTLWRQAQALIAARRGSFDEAESLAREAVRRAGPSDMLQLQGEAFSDLAEVLEAAGHRDGAIAAWQEALDRYERKQIIPLARRVRKRLAAIQPTQA
jgi:tetratricopeptide (TPR) repeat protein